ncbi:MAG: hypothetical protein IBX55_06940 [Methyloprofundus sp.]|nr:hypothetical protein [Methyloprofundus sp.]MBW6453843.1 hypothetical protein [Methyloprofundus sp.]
MKINLNNESDSELTNNDQPIIVKPQNTQQHETDSEMLIRISKKFAIIFVLILMFDFILDLLFGLLDLIIELIHLVIEFFEHSLEVLIEHIFHTDPHESEVILANLTMILLLYLIIRYFRVLPKLLIHQKQNIQASWLKCKRDWRALSLGRKIKIGTAYSVGICGVLFLLTL